MADQPGPTDLVAALDVGGTFIKAGLLERDGNPVLQLRRDTAVADGVDAVVRGILTLIEELITAAPAGTVVRAVGLGVPGVVDSAAGIARYAANLGWRELPLVQLIADSTVLPVVLGHDVRNAALAEARLGMDAGTPGAGSVFFVSIGTGIAAGLVENGVVSEGFSGQAGEIGHLVVRPGGPLCGCGNSGCLEAIASASRISSRFRDSTGRAANAQEVADLVASGDPDATSVWSEAVAALADALAAATVLLDPGRFVLGGGLSLAGATLTVPLRAALAERLTFRTPPPMSVTTLGDRAGLLGASVRAYDLLDSLDHVRSENT